MQRAVVGFDQDEQRHMVSATGVRTQPACAARSAMDGAEWVVTEVERRARTGSLME